MCHRPPEWDMPEQIEAQVTFGGLEGATVYYDTTGINAGDEMRIAMQIDALATISLQAQK